MCWFQSPSPETSDNKLLTLTLPIESGILIIQYSSLVWHSHAEQHVFFTLFSFSTTTTSKVLLILVGFLIISIYPFVFHTYFDKSFTHMSVIFRCQAQSTNGAVDFWPLNGSSKLLGNSKKAMLECTRNLPRS